VVRPRQKSDQGNHTRPRMSRKEVCSRACMRAFMRAWCVCVVMCVSYNVDKEQRKAEQYANSQTSPDRIQAEQITTERPRQQRIRIRETTKYKDITH
jgi:hypothetical protein